MCGREQSSLSTDSTTFLICPLPLSLLCLVSILHTSCPFHINTFKFWYSVLHHPSVYSSPPSSSDTSYKADYLDSKGTSCPAWALTSQTKPYPLIHGHPPHHTWIPAPPAEFLPMLKSFSAYLDLTTPHHSTLLNKIPSLPWSTSDHLHRSLPNVEIILTWIMLQIPVKDHPLTPYMTPSLSSQASTTINPHSTWAQIAFSEPPWLSLHDHKCSFYLLASHQIVIGLICSQMEGK